MKTLLLIGLCLISLGVKAQSSGDYLTKAGKQMQTGFWLTLGGTAVTVGTMYLPHQDFESRMVRGMSIAAAVSGVVLTYSGYCNIRKAGEARQTGLLLTPSGLCYRF